MKKIITLLWFFTLVLCDSKAQYIDVSNYDKISDGTNNFPADSLDDGDRFGYSVAGIGDLDKDGVNDMVVGAFADDDGATSAGAVWVLFMNANGTVKDNQKISNWSGGLGNILTSNSFFGAAVEGLGDLNGDGVVDIAVGSSYLNQAVYILFLDTDGTVQSYQKIASGIGGFTGTLNSGDFFGESVANIGDLNGDGIIDLAVGAYGNDDGGSARGAVWILFLDTDGTVKSQLEISDGNNGFPADSLDNSDYLGYSVSSIGDLNKDGITDIAVGAIKDDDIYDAGAIWILFLDTNGTVQSYQKISATQGNFNGVLNTGNNFGSSCQYMGDIDNDGYTNLMVGAWKDDAGGGDKGAVWILNVDTNGVVIDENKICDTLSTFTGHLDVADYFGYSVGMLGDIDQNGSMEFLVGTRNDDDGGTDRGAVYIISLDLPPYTAVATSYAKLKNKLDGGFVYVYEQELHFQYNEEYEVGAFRSLAYNIYDKNHDLVGGVDLSGNVLVAGSESMENKIGEHLFILDITALSLTDSEYYTLEVINDKNEKKLLKFKIYN